MRQKLISYLWAGIGALATGTMLVLALPLGEQAWIAWFMLVPLLLTTKEKGFLVGFLGGLGAVFWCAWLSASGVFYRHKNFEPSNGWTYTACGLYAFSFAIFFAIWADRKNNEKPIWWLAALAVVLESVLLLEIPATLALTQYRNSYAVGIASVGGIWITSFFVWFINLEVVNIRKGVWKWGYILFIPFVAKSCFRFPAYYDTKFDQDKIVVGVAQIADGLDKELLAAHLEASLAKPAFVVWPEFAGMLFVRGDDTSKLEQASVNSSPIITSFRDTATPLPHNVAAMYSDGKESARYEKRKLFASESKMHTPGTKAIAVPFGAGSVGLNICFDSCYPNNIRESAALPNVRVVALPTIDPDSPHYFVAAVHAAYTPFRCAENGVAMARADGNFGSMIVNEQGHIVAELKNEQKSLTGTISGKRDWTVYQVLGDWFWYLCIFGVILYPIVTWARKKKVNNSNSEFEHEIGGGGGN